MGAVQTWDTHGDNFNALKKRLLPPFDKGVSALLEDLAASGLLDETLVVMAGEFGRTPKIGNSGGSKIPDATTGGPSSPPPSPCRSARWAVHRSVRQDRRLSLLAGLPSRRPRRDDLSALGVPADTEVRDRLNRPIRLIDGEPIAPLYQAHQSV